MVESSTALVRMMFMKLPLFLVDIMITLDT